MKVLFVLAPATEYVGLDRAGSPGTQFRDREVASTASTDLETWKSVAQSAGLQPPQAKEEAAAARS